MVPHVKDSDKGSLLNDHVERLGRVPPKSQDHVEKDSDECPSPSYDHAKKEWCA